MRLAFLGGHACHEQERMTKQKIGIYVVEAYLAYTNKMDDALAKIRPHTSSSLPHQKSPANLLTALESTFNEQSTEPSPTAYFAALLTTLDATIQKGDVSLGEGDVLPAELYLLALIVPFVAAPVIQTNLKTILSLTGPLFPSLIPHAPALRSQLALYHVIFQSLDRSQLETPGIRQSFASILQLCIDPRPKVRKKAASVIQSVLASPPTPLARHPYSEAVADWVKSALSKVNTGPLSRAKAPDASGAEIAIHILAFLRPVLSNLPPTVSDFKFHLTAKFTSHVSGYPIPRKFVSYAPSPWQCVPFAIHIFNHVRSVFAVPGG
jgi:ribosomal RNA-processing protein 12